MKLDHVFVLVNFLFVINNDNDDNDDNDVNDSVDGDNNDGR